MTPTTFPEANGTLLGWPEGPAPLTPEVGDLPVYRGGEPPQIISCWHATWKERFSILLFGKVWVYVLARQTHYPLALRGVKSGFTYTKD